MTMDPTRPVAPPPSPAPAPSAPVAPVAPVAAVAPRAKSGGVLNLLLVGAAILAIGGVAFAVGRSTAPASAFPGAGTFPGGGNFTNGPIVRPGGSFAPGAGGPGGFAFDGGLAIDGTVTSVDADSLTLTLDNGEEMTFALDGDTTYHEATDAAPGDVAIGDGVSVKVDGGRGIQGGNGGSTTPNLTAGDVTVSR